MLGNTHKITHPNDHSHFNCRTTREWFRRETRLYLPPISPPFLPTSGVDESFYCSRGAEWAAGFCDLYDKWRDGRCSVFYYLCPQATSVVFINCKHTFGGTPVAVVTSANKAFKEALQENDVAYYQGWRPPVSKCSDPNDPMIIDEST
eukprot:TRINITY_DN35398_c0_g1_i1.p1 TRINITY_DN35398_c0_g1~~TRINITY_DN35398_c0_g1_i1.p1  ORF type:complete len:148 (-),score=5.03 TRINITY_DN35398_c0_g1_i1:704-1147(-)